MIHLRYQIQNLSTAIYLMRNSRGGKVKGGPEYEISHDPDTKNNYKNYYKTFYRRFSF